jgi:hypothetical protein
MKKILSKIPINSFASKFIPYASNLINKYQPIIPYDQKYMYLDKFKTSHFEKYYNINLYRFNNNISIDNCILDFNTDNLNIKEIIKYDESFEYLLLYNNKQILKLQIEYNINNLDLINIYNNDLKNIINNINKMIIQIDHTK